MTLQVRNIDEVQGEMLGEFVRRVVFAPSLDNSQYLRMAIVSGAPGARGKVHVHLGNESVYTWKGEVSMVIQGAEYRVGPGQAIAIPPDTEHPAQVVSDEPWVSVCFYCDECPVLKAYRAAGGPLRVEEPCVTDGESIEPQSLGELCRRVLYTPSCNCVNFQRLALVDGGPGAQGASHTHLGNEILFTLGGGVTQIIDCHPYRVSAGNGLAVPPDVTHLPVVTDPMGWSAVAAFCDECPALLWSKQQEAK